MESKDPLTDFDAVGFTLQYELSYTNILAMLDLAGIPFYSKDRDELLAADRGGRPLCLQLRSPLRISLTSFSWARVRISCPASAPKSRKAKKEGGVSKKELLLRIAKIPGVYIPAFYDRILRGWPRSSPSLPTSRASRRSSPRPSSRI